ncbi:MAG: tRNA (adenosine(37)-N6)-dimethylallyltransferase MiaA [Desulfopila sp.]|jgi:tRNA dimethylallyltransferase|nr:tRNA (adenosine(37)-N6)-dimethylallyltransferase MiaA [Desulfopila sp.]
MTLAFPVTEPVIVVVGPTAIGKTELSLSIAEIFSCEIISLDSMQVYRYMDIGTAKVSREERERIPHYLLDMVYPDDEYNANRFVKDTLEALEKIYSKNKIPLLTGGTGLYLRALTEGLFETGACHPDIRLQIHQKLQEKGSSKLHEELSLVDRNSAHKIHVNDTHRLLRALEIFYATGKSWSEHLAAQAKHKGKGRFTNILQLGLISDRETLYRRINSRTSHMLEKGFKEEVEGLLDMGYDPALKSMQSIGYRHMLDHILNNISLAETEASLSRDTRRYAKRQYTWFKKMELEWFHVASHDKILQRIEDFIGH